MTLAALIAKGGLAQFATATSATPATYGPQKAGTVATVATVAVANSPAGEPARRWSVRFKDLQPMEVLFTPPASRRSPALIAFSVRPSAATASSGAGDSFESESSGSTGVFDSFESATVFTDERDRAEALAAAITDPDAALTSFRTLTAEPPADPDDRRTCSQCANLATDGRCRAAARGVLFYAVSRKYAPATDLLKRCEGFRPLAADPDQRPGAVRWPELTRPADAINDLDLS